MATYHGLLMEFHGWQHPVISILSTPPSTPTKGDRHIVGASATGAWLGHEDDIATYDGSAWLFTSPGEGWKVHNNDTGLDYLYDGSSWGTDSSSLDEKVKANSSATAGYLDSQINTSMLEVETVNNKLQIKASGVSEVELAASVAGDGLNGGAGAALSVNASDIVDTTKGLDTSANDIYIKLESDGGIQFDATNGGLEIKPDATGGANLAAAISVSANGVAVKVDDSSIEDNGSGQLSVKDGGITNAMLAGSIDDSKLATSYSKIDGTRDFTGIVGYDSHKTFLNDTDIVDRKFVLDQVAALSTASEWQDSVIDLVDFTTAEPSTPSVGDRYINTVTGTSSGTSQSVTADYIYEWNGADWSEIIPSTGTFTSSDAHNDRLYYYGGSSWTAKYFEATTASLGVKKSGFDIQLDYVSGGGIALSGNSAYVNVDDIIGNGVENDGSGNIQVKLDTTTGGNVSQALSITSSGLGVKIDNTTIKENASNQLELDPTLKSNYDTAYSLRGVVDTALGVMVFDNQ